MEPKRGGTFLYKRLLGFYVNLWSIFRFGERKPVSGAITGKPQGYQSFLGVPFFETNLVMSFCVWAKFGVFRQALGLWTLEKSRMRIAPLKPCVLRRNTYAGAFSEQQTHPYTNQKEGV